MYDDAYRATTQEEKLKSCRYDEAEFLYVHQSLSSEIADGKDIDNGLLQTIIESAEYIPRQRPSQYIDVRNALWFWRSYRRSKESDEKFKVLHALSSYRSELVEPGIKQLPDAGSLSVHSYSDAIYDSVAPSPTVAAAPVGSDAADPTATSADPAAAGAVLVVRTDSSAADVAALAADATDPGEDAAGDEEDQEEMDNEEHNVSLAAMEITLLPQMLVTFEQIATTYKCSGPRSSGRGREIMARFGPD